MINTLELYNIGRFFRRKGLVSLSYFCEVLNRKLNRCAIYSETIIGKGTTLAYGGIAIVIHRKAILGENCTISQGVTIGRDPTLAHGVPSIGDNVYIGAGAVVFGDIHIGSNSIIAPNSIVNSDVEDHSIVGGIPAKLIKKIDSKSVSYQAYGVKLPTDDA